MNKLEGSFMTAETTVTGVMTPTSSRTTVVVQTQFMMIVRLVLGPSLEEARANIGAEVVGIAIVGVRRAIMETI